ncbi:MAG: preprotein translocase subunit YajC [Succinivibrio sp.]
MSIISVANAAEGAAPAAQGGDMSMIIVLTICMIAVYFFFMRPNSKKRKEMQKLLDNLAVGDEVLTNGGIAGRIVKLPDNKEYVLMSVSSGVVMQIKRNYVVAVLPKGTLEAVSVEKAASAKK